MVERAKSIEEALGSQVFRDLIPVEGRQIVYPSILLLFQCLDDLDVNYHIFKHKNDGEAISLYQATLYRGTIGEPEGHFTTHKHEDLKAVLFEMIMHESFKLGWNNVKKLWLPPKGKDVTIV